MRHQVAVSDDEVLQRRELVDRFVGLQAQLRSVFKVTVSPEQRARFASLTMHQLEALTVLDEGARSMGELCERLDIAEGAGTTLVDKLVAHGLVERAHASSDRRVVRVALSRDAAAMTTAYRELRRERALEVLSALSLSELSSLVAACEKVAVPLRPRGLAARRSGSDHVSELPTP